MRTFSLHFPAESYRQALADEHFRPEQVQAIAEHFRDNGAKTLIYGSGQTGRMLRDILGESYLCFINSDTIDAEINLDFDCILVGTSPRHYRDVYYKIKRAFSDKDVTVIFPFEFSAADADNLWDNFYRFSRLLLTITHTCNLKCKMCGFHLDTSNLTLSRERLLEGAKFGLDNGFSIIELVGGEPFLIDAVYDAIDMLRNTPPKLFMSTNGTLLGDKQIEFLSGIKNLHVQVSFDGTREIHNAIRGRDFAFDNTDRAIRKMAALGIPISINSVVQRDNMFDLYDLYNYFADLPYTWHAFALYDNTPVNMDNDAYHDAMRLPAEALPEVTKALHRIKEAADKANKTVSVDNLLKVVDQRVGKLDDSPKSNRFLHPGLCCTVPRTQVILKANGLPVPCVHYNWKKSIAHGDLANKSIHDIVYSQDYMQDILEATGLDGCPGCSTGCYVYDPDFCRKVFNPTHTDKVLAELNELAHAKDDVFG